MLSSVLSFLFLIPCITSVGFGLFSIRSAAAFFSKKDRVDPSFAPPVSVLRSVCGVDAGTYENLASFCRQDYPQFQILLAVHDPQDPAVPVIRRLIRDFPQVDIQLFLCPRALGTNPKVSNLMQVESKARHPFLLVCDSDVRVEQDTLRRVVQPMVDPKVGAVTCMCRSQGGGWVSTLEALREATEFCPGVLAAHRLEGIQFGLGAAILVRRTALERIGGLASIADYLADDFLLGNRIAHAGYSVVLSGAVVDHGLSLDGLRSLAQRQLRWNRGIRVCRPWGYRGLVFTYGVPMSMLFLAVSGVSAFTLSVLAMTWTARLGMARVVGGRWLKAPAARRFLWLVPVQDTLSFALWCAGLFGRTIRWRGRVFRLADSGKLIPVGGQAPDLSTLYDDATVAAAAQ